MESEGGVRVRPGCVHEKKKTQRFAVSTIPLRSTLSIMQTLGFQDLGVREALGRKVKMRVVDMGNGVPLFEAHAKRKCTDDEWQEVLHGITIFLNKLSSDNYSQFCMLINMRDRCQLSVEQVCQAALVIKEWRLLFKSKLIGTSVVVYSPTMKTIIDTVLTIFTPTRPLKTFHGSCDDQKGSSLHTREDICEFFNSLKTCSPDAGGCMHR